MAVKFHTADRIKIAPGFWSGLLQFNITPQDIALQAGLPLTVISEPVVTTAQYFAIWRAYSDLMGDTARGIISLATAFEAAHYPPAALATYHARDYRDALNRMARYKPFCPPEKLRITESGELCIIELGWLDPHHAGPSILIGITFAYLLELGRRGTGRAITALSVELSQPMGDRVTLEAYFGCGIQTGTVGNRLILQREDLDKPFTTYNEELLAILTPALDQSLNEHQDKPSISEQVKWLIKRSLSGGRTDIQTVSRELGMSGRTLQRRLADEKVSFKQLVGDARHEQARELLADPALDIKEVAFLVGYADQNSFYRAFRLREGETPSNWRVKQEFWR
ncbi:helix-turn-helix transcriptional regulator [Paenibacillus sp. FSL K6-1230]|uniref:helix-turn-helix transcriptional regulator n=1 Tax=Paenibacillus sp. FSL K6-1230 TaxID=2921603 RepID=UPI0030F67A87